MAEKLSSKEFLEAFYTSCPRCGCEDQEELDTVDFGDGSFIRTCSSCFWATGIDDSVDLLDLDDNAWEFHPEDGSNSCLSVDISHFPIFVGFSSDGRMKGKCGRCLKCGHLVATDSESTTDTTDDDSEEMLYLESLAQKCSYFEDHYNNPFAEQNEVESEGQDIIGEWSNGETATHIVCDCGNSEPGCFEEVSGLNRRDQPTLKCFQCGACYAVDIEEDQLEQSCIFCDKCRNDVRDCFALEFNDSGKLVSAKCLVCDTENRYATASKLFENVKCMRIERVTSWSMLSPGDHISFQRPASYKHHAIVIEVNQNQRKLRYIEYGSNASMATGKPTLACVQEKDKKIVDFDSIYLYRYDYDPENCYEPEEVIARARSRISERKYHAFNNNCEHFATWCKTGKAICNQVKPFLRRLLGLKFSIAINEMTKPLMELIETVLQSAAKNADDVLRLVTQNARKIIKPTGMLLKVGRIGFMVLINLVVELVMFYFNYQKAKEELETGKISEEEFRKRKSELVGESIGGLVLGIAIGMPWFTGVGILISIPLIILGVAIGRICGSWIGRKLNSVIRKKTND